MGATPATAFRADIQGLRAVAVLLVIADHVGVGRVAGGFIGVDVFFVVSGFLITGLLLRDVSTGGRVRLTDFYARRARRILPAAVTVLAATIVAGSLVLPAIRSIELVKDALWSAAFGANFHFAAVGTDYFSQDQPPSALQHYWSLSVEEQFYLVWPLALVILGLVAQGRFLRRRRLTLVVLVGLAASFAWSIIATHQSPTAAYFSTPARAWELGIGALAAIVLSGPVPALPSRLLAAANVLGLGAIIASALVFDHTTPAPGWAVAVPVLGTAAILLSGSMTQSRGALASRLLAVRPAQWIGDRSYSLYLWHFPIIMLTAGALGVRHLSWKEALGCVVLTVVASAFSYRYIEEPIRRGTWIRRSTWASIALYPAGVALILATGVAGRDYVEQAVAGGNRPPISTAQYQGSKLSTDKYVALVQASVLAARDDRKVPSRLTPPLLGLRAATASLGDCDYRSGTTKLCPRGDATADRSIVLIGDSHARAWIPAVEEIGKRNGFATYALVFSGCSANQAVQVDHDTRRPWDDCTKFKQWTIDTVARLEPDIVIVATSALGPVLGPDGSPLAYKDGAPFRSAIENGYRAELEALAPHTHRLVALANTPQLPRETGVCLSRRGADLGDCLFSPGPVKRSIQLQFLQQARQIGALAVDAEPWFCADEKCPSVVGDFIPMRDAEHPTPEYARWLAPALAAALGISKGAL